MKPLIISFSIALLFASPQAFAQPHYNYLTYLPPHYDSTRHKRWPLIIYLHGKSACGNDLEKVRRYGLPFFTDRGLQIEAVAISPQCPEGKNWTSENWLDPFLKEVTRKYCIDTNRIYLTGMSLGGFGTWDLAIRHPRRFAAIAPLCGGGKPQLVCALKDLPIWVLHGDQDEQVPVRRSEEMVEALRKCGGHPKFTVLKGFPHDIHRFYGNENLYKWMLQYRLNDPPQFDDKALAVNDTLTKIPGMTGRMITDMVKTADKAEKKNKVDGKVKATGNHTEEKQKAPMAAAPLQPGKVKRKPDKETQTDTIRSKDFILVF